MSEKRGLYSKCVIQNCKTSIQNSSPGTILYSLPTNEEMRNRWMSILKIRCGPIDWNRHKICSNHFDKKCFDINRKLRDNAIPTMFSKGSSGSLQKATPSSSGKGRVEKLLSKMPISDLQEDVKKTVALIKMPEKYDTFISDDLRCDPLTPTDIQLGLLIMKQDYIITKLTQRLSHDKKLVEDLQNNIDEIKAQKKDIEQALQHQKYIAKCLQEKQATLEEQVEILTAVESK